MEFWDSSGCLERQIKKACLCLDGLFQCPSKPLDIQIKITYLFSKHFARGKREGLLTMKTFCSLVFCLVSIAAFAQPGALILGELIDTPVAKTIPQASVQSTIRLYQEGGVLGSIQVGLTPRIAMGLSWGGENIIGSGDVDLNPRPEVHVQYLMFQELYLSPAILIGFQSQGSGAYISSLERYTVKSRGFYAVASKNTAFLGGLGIHAGINWSMENKDGDHDPNLFAGCHKWINPELVILTEYDTAINDNNDNAVGSGKGYFNAAVRWSVAQTFFMEFDWKNIFENNSTHAGSSREIKLVYFTSFI